MNSIQAIILGIVQGLTEFLPISSSGHLKLTELFFGLKNLENYLFFDVVCHLGTLAAIFIYFAKDILEILQRRHRMIGWLFLATLPLLPIPFLLKPIKNIFNQPEYLGYFFLLTALILYLGIRLGKRSQQPQTWKGSFIVGIFQALAIFPGVSRSGTTISVARILGWSVKEAILFSFLLAIPTIIGGAAVLTLEFYLTEVVLPISTLQYLLGFLTSLIVGYFAIHLLVRLVTSDKFMIFVWYCLLLGIVTIIYVEKTENSTSTSTEAF